MEFGRSTDFFSAPVPSDDLLQADGHVAIDAFPNPRDIDIVRSAKALVARDARGFAQSGAIFFKLSADLDRSRLPTMSQSVQPTATIFLIGVDKNAPDFMHRYPITVAFESDGGPFGSSRLLSLLPLQGIPLRPGTRYAAVVMRETPDIDGKPLGRSAAMAALAAGRQPDGLSGAASSHYREALDALVSHGIKAERIAGLAVFTTDTPMASFDAVRRDMLARPLPVPSAFASMEVFDNFCVYKGTVDLPEYQRGAAPYASEGGDWVFDEQGHPSWQRNEKARVVVTVPRTTMPTTGYPTALFVRCGGGGDRPLVDRGVQATTGGEAITPGTGPALELARVGFAGISIDGPQGGLRNVSNGDEEFLMFNVQNPPALRDNVRQSAIETILMAHVLEQMSIDVSNCPGATGPARFDTDSLALVGHSMGASIAPLAAAWEPRFKAMVLSGAGGSYIYNITDKKKPVEVKPLAEVLLEYEAGKLTEHDPVLTLVQWAAEPSDTQVFARSIIQEPLERSSPRHVLMEQGIVDNYIRPRIANTLSLSLGLDLGGTPLDAMSPELTTVETPLEQLLVYSGRQRVTLPAQGNLVVQHAEDGREDGHEVFFQLEGPKNQYRCFLKGFAAGSVPTVVTDSGVCP